MFYIKNRTKYDYILCNGGVLFVMNELQEKTLKNKVEGNSNKIENLTEAVEKGFDDVKKGFKKYDNTIDCHTEEIECNRKIIRDVANNTRENTSEVNFVKKIAEKLEETVDKMGVKFDRYIDKIDKRAEKTDENMINLTQQTLDVIKAMSNNSAKSNDSNNKKKSAIWGYVLAGVVAIISFGEKILSFIFNKG
jgi:methyl-accepting chemotaxis protein